MVKSKITHRTKQSSLLLKVYLFIALLLSITLASCGSSEQDIANKEAEVPKTEEDLMWEGAEAVEGEEEEENLPLNQQLDELNVAILDLQKMAFESERSKINDSQSLITEVEQSFSEYDRPMLAVVKVDLKELESALYNEETLADEATMEEYDIRTEKLIGSWKTFKENTTELEKQIRAKQIYGDIMAANDQDAKIRRNYNIYVHDFNTLLESRKAEIEKLGEKYTMLQPYLFFYGSDPVVQ